MASPVILIISRSETRMQTYREALERLGVSCVGLADLKGAPALAAQTPMNGIAIDMPVQIKASPGDKALVEDMMLALPSAYLNILPATDTIRVLTATGTQGTFHTFEQFVAACTNFVGRVVRPKDRTELNLNALLYHGTATDASQERTATINVSPGGCFLFSCHPGYHVEQLVRIEFVNLADHTPIIASIRWLQPWGTSHLLPGIGVQFERITEAQQTELNALLRALEPRSR